MEWGGGSEECKEVWQLKHFLSLSISSILQKLRIFFRNITSPSSTRCPSGLVAEGSQGWAAPPWWCSKWFCHYSFIIAIVIMWLCAPPCYVMCMWCDMPCQQLYPLYTLGKGLAYNLEVKSFLSWQPPTTCCSSCTGAPGWRSSPSWSSSRRPRSWHNGCFPCSS